MIPNSIGFLSSFIIYQEYGTQNDESNDRLAWHFPKLNTFLVQVEYKGYLF